MIDETGLSAFQRASVLMQKAAREALGLPAEKRRVLAVLYAELLEIVPPHLLKSGEHGTVTAVFEPDGTPVRAVPIGEKEN